MRYTFSTITLLIIALVCLPLLGCLSSLKSVLGEQQLSENYTTTIMGVQATTPEMIDGNLMTSGRSTFPAGSEMVYGSTALSEAVVILPEKKSIRRIVIYSPNLKVFDIMADEGGGWEIIEEVKGVTINPIDIRIDQVTYTDRIKIRVRVTKDDASVRRRLAASGTDLSYTRGNTRAEAVINEIQIYGYATKKTEVVQKVEEDELDKLLNQ